LGCFNHLLEEHSEGASGDNWLFDIKRRSKKSTAIDIFPMATS